MTLTLLLFLLACIAVTISILINIQSIAVYRRTANSLTVNSPFLGKLKREAEKSTKVAFITIGFFALVMLLVFSEILGYTEPVIIW